MINQQFKRSSRIQSVDNSFVYNKKNNFPSPFRQRDPDYSFSEGTSLLNDQAADKKAKTKLPQFKPSTSLAEENLVKDFNKFIKLENINLPTNQPQRIELPLFFNTPIRTQQLRSKSFQKTGQQKKINSLQPSQIDSAQHIRAQRRLKDYNMLGFACRRSGKVRDEGRTYYSQGVLCDNMGKLKEAIIHYKKFLQVCRTIGDSHGEALAYNCIGVNYQFLGEQEDPRYYKEAIVFHKKHEELADINGKFLALINLGLCFDKMGLQEESLMSYQNALRHSIKMANLVGQTIAIGNIGKIGTGGLAANKEKMKIYIEKYLKLSNELRDTNGELNAHLKLGQLDIQSSDYNNSKLQFGKALNLAKQNGDQTLYGFSKCGFAISNVESQIQEQKKEYENSFILKNSQIKLENDQY